MRRRPRVILAAGVAILLVALSWTCGAAEPGDAMQAIRQAEADGIPARNAVYLFLRLAGIVWIAVEWSAALILWRVYRLLRGSLQEQGLT